MALTKAHNRMIEGAAVNVKDFGAKGDGVTDDTAAIQAAIDSVNAAGGGRIYLPSGTYLVSSIITTYKYISIIGENSYATTIKQKDASNLNAIIQIANFATLKDSNSWLVGADNMPHSFEFADFAIDGNKANQTSGDGVGIRVYGKRYFVKNVFIYNTRGVGFYSEAGAAGGQSEPYDMPETIISGLYVYSSGSYGIHYRGPHDGYIESAFVSNAGNNGIQLEESANYLGSCDIGFVHVYGCSGNGIAVNAPIFASYIQPESNTGRGLTATKSVTCGIFRAYQNNDTALYLDSNLSKISKVEINDNNGADGIRVIGNKNTLSNVKVTGNNNGNAVGILVNGEENRVVGRVFDYDGTGGIGLKSLTTFSDNFISLNISNCETGFENAVIGATNDLNIIFACGTGQTAVTETASIAESSDVNFKGTSNNATITSTYKETGTVDMSSTSIQEVVFNHTLYKSPTAQGVQVSLQAPATAYTSGFQTQFLGVAQISATQIRVRFKLASTSATGNGSVVVRAEIP